MLTRQQSQSFGHFPQDREVFSLEIVFSFQKFSYLVPTSYFFKELPTRQNANKVLNISGHKDERGCHIFSSPLNVSGSTTNGCLSTSFYHMCSVVFRKWIPLFLIVTETSQEMLLSRHPHPLRYQNSLPQLTHGFLYIHSSICSSTQQVLIRVSLHTGVS